MIFTIIKTSEITEESIWTKIEINTIEELIQIKKENNCELVIREEEWEIILEIIDAWRS